MTAKNTSSRHPFQTFHKQKNKYQKVEKLRELELKIMKAKNENRIAKLIGRYLRFHIIRRPLNWRQKIQYEAYFVTFQMLCLNFKFRGKIYRIRQFFSNKHEPNLWKNRSETHLLKSILPTFFNSIKKPNPNQYVFNKLEVPSEWVFQLYILFRFAGRG